MESGKELGWDAMRDAQRKMAGSLQVCYYIHCSGISNGLIRQAKYWRMASVYFIPLWL